MGLSDLWEQRVVAISIAMANHVRGRLKLGRPGRDSGHEVGCHAYNVLIIEELLQRIRRAFLLWVEQRLKQTSGERLVIDDRFRLFNPTHGSLRS